MTPANRPWGPTSSAGSVAELEAKQQVLSTERDILRAAAKYFAGETH